MIHNHTFWWRFFPKQELTQIYASMAVRSFSLSMVSLFVPLFLYNQLKYSLQETLLFFLVYSLVLGATCPLAAKFSSRYGCKHAVLISFFLYLLFLVGLYILPVFKIPLVVAALFGVSISFYWMGMHIVFRKASDEEHRAEEFGKRECISILASILGPLVGGYLIQFMGFKAVFVLATFTLFISGGFLFLSKEEHVPYHFSLRSLLRMKEWKDNLFFISRGVRIMVAGVVWPLFIFVVLKNYFSLGLIESVLAAVSALLLWLVGRFSDKYNRHEVLHLVAGFEAVSWFMRALVSTVGQVLGMTIFGAITYGSFEAPAGALEYDKARKDIGAYFVRREVYFCVGRCLAVLLVMVSGSLTSGLILNGFTTFAAWLF